MQVVARGHSLTNLPTERLRTERMHRNNDRQYLGNIPSAQLSRATPSDSQRQKRADQPHTIAKTIRPIPIRAIFQISDRTSENPATDADA